MDGAKAKPKRTPRKQRLYFIIFSLVCIAVAVTAILVSLQDNIVFFRTPSDLISKPARAGEQIRMGGLVKTGSLKQNKDGSYEFVITDKTNELKVKFNGVFPNLFREGQGVVAYGALNNDGSFTAKDILAKHDEKYMPREVYNAIKDKGYLKPQ